jgi:ABC-2 type transport system permease protein
MANRNEASGPPDPHPGAQDPGAELSTPSRVEEAAPTLARNIGLTGAFVFAVGVVLWLANLDVLPWIRDLMNAKPGQPVANWLFIRLWIILGAVGMAYHAAREPEARLRRLYGFFALGLCSFGAVFLSFVLLREGLAALLIGETTSQDVVRKAFSASRWYALLSAALMSLSIAALALAPFNPLNFIPRLVKHFGGELRSTALAIAAIEVGVVLLVLWVATPLRDMLREEQKRLFQSDTPLGLVLFGMAPTGIWTLLLGLVFIVLQQRTEEEESWRLSGLGVVGWIGAVAAAVAFGTGIADLVKLPDVLMPYGLVLGLVGFPLLWVCLSQLPTDSDLVYRSGWWLRAVGLLFVVYAVGRSIYPAFAEEFLDKDDVSRYLVPNGCLLTFLGLLYAWLGHCFASEGRLTAVVKRELIGYFCSPIAYVVLGGMVIMAWLAHLLWIEDFFRNAGLPFPEPILREYSFGFLPVFAFILAVPMLTMRLLSEEQRTGTYEVLMTAPVEEWQVVLGKFLSSWIMFMFCWSAWLVFPLAYRAWSAESFDYRPALTFFVGTGLMASGFLAMGLFFSSITKNQIIALLLGIGVMFLLFTPAFFFPPGASSTAYEIVELTSFYHHMYPYSAGQIYWKHVVYYASFALFWLFLTVKVLEARKWK